MNLYFK